MLISFFCLVCHPHPEKTNTCAVKIPLYFMSFPRCFVISIKKTVIPIIFFRITVFFYMKNHFQSSRSIFGVSCASIPPSTTNSAPVVFLDASVEKYHTAFAISSKSAISSIGV